MKMIIEITDHADMIELHAMLSSYSRMAQHVLQDAPVDSDRVNFGEDAAEETPAPKVAASRRRKATGNGMAEPAVAAEAVADTGPEAQPEPEPEVKFESVENPFADEVKQAKKAKKLSREDVNAAFTAYIHTFGQTAAMTDVVKILTEQFGVSKLSAIPNTQEAYGKAIDVVSQAIESNSFGRERI